MASLSSEHSEEAYEAAWRETERKSIEQGLSWSGNERNHLFLNLGDLRFADLSALSGCDVVGDGRAVSPIDWDGDGRMDLLLRNRTAPRLQLFRNVYAPQNFLTVDLEGNGSTTNRDAIGARVEVEVADRRLERTLRASDGYLAQPSKRLHFGLDGDSTVRRLTVHWPDGTRDVHEGLAGSRHYRIVQGAGAPLPVEARGRVRIAAESPATRAEANCWRVVLADALQVGAVPVPGIDDPQTAGRTVSDFAGGPLLLSVWHLNCAHCLSQLNGIRARRSEVDASGLRVLTVNVDPPEDLARAREYLSWYDLDGTEADHRDPRLIAALEILHDEVLEGSLAAPTSFLIDGAGNLSVLYVGAVRMEELLADVSELGREDGRPSIERLAHGRRIRATARDHLDLASRFEAADLTELAAWYREAAGKGGSVSAGGTSTDR